MALPNNQPVPTLGLIELSSIAKGLLVCDFMMKKAEVDLLRAGPVGCGKFMIHVTGPEADLLEAVEEGRDKADTYLVSWTFIPNLHPQVLAALQGRRSSMTRTAALGIIEGRALAALVHAADLAVKTTAVDLLELTFDLDLGGKGFFTLAGDLAEVEAALFEAETELALGGGFVQVGVECIGFQLEILLKRGQRRCGVLNRPTQSIPARLVADGVGHGHAARLIGQHDERRLGQAVADGGRHERRSAWRGNRHRQPVPQDELGRAPRYTGWTCQYRTAIQVTLEVLGEICRRSIAPARFGAKRGERDAVELTMESLTDAARALSAECVAHLIGDYRAWPRRRRGALGQCHRCR